jgi:CHAD domain-containing protein
MSPKREAVPRDNGRKRPIYSLHDAVLSLLDSAIAALSAEQSDEAVHKARKAAKRSRAALRLLRESLGPSGYHRGNRAIRDAAKPLTAVRDAFMLRKVLHRMPNRPRALEHGLKSEYLRERRSFKRRDCVPPLRNWKRRARI